MRATLLVLSIVGGCAAARVHAQSFPGAQEAPERGARMHDGWLIRATLGLGYASLDERRERELLDGDDTRVESSTVTVRGLCIAFGLDLGHSLNDWLALHVRLSQLAIPDPDLGGLSSARGDNSRSPTMLGAGLSAFLPHNAYVTLATGYAVVREARFDGDTALGDAGVALNVDLGWEGWVAAQWGVGVAARLWWLRVAGGDPGQARERDGYALSLMASVTYH